MVSPVATADVTKLHAITFLKVDVSTATMHRGVMYKIIRYLPLKTLATTWGVVSFAMTRVSSATHDGRHVDKCVDEHDDGNEPIVGEENVDVTSVGLGLDLLCYTRAAVLVYRRHPNIEEAQHGECDARDSPQCVDDVVRQPLEVVTDGRANHGQDKDRALLSASFLERG